MIRGRMWKLLPFILKGESPAGASLLATPAWEPTSPVICEPQVGAANLGYRPEQTRLAQ